jgi:RIO-like serine/threonine protein kinase
MVVMEYIDGETCEDGVSDAVRIAVCDTVEYLHSQGMVHGDVRRPNIIIERGEGDDEECRVKILDFDWAGREGEARYPLRLSPGLWPDGVGDNKFILAVHDIEMLKRL